MKTIIKEEEKKIVYIILGKLFCCLYLNYKKEAIFSSEIVMNCRWILLLTKES